MLPIIIEVADQKPIFFASDDVVGIIEKEDNEKTRLSTGIRIYLYRCLLNTVLVNWQPALTVKRFI